MIGLDSNVIIYLEGIDDAARQATAEATVGALIPEGLVVPAQVLGEFHRVAVGKAKWPATEAASAMRRWTEAAEVVPTTQDVMMDAAELHRAAGLRIWDAVIVCAAAAAGCDLLLSEDMQDGFRHGRMTIVNPFAETLHPLLSARLKATP